MAVNHLHKITTWTIFIFFLTTLFFIGINMPTYKPMLLEPKPKPRLAPGVKRVADSQLPPSIGCEWNPSISTNGTVSKNSSDTQCSQMVKSFMKNKVVEVLFVGDSTMRLLWNEAHVIQSGKPSAAQVMKSCHSNWLHTFGIKPSNFWRQPNLEKEGPCGECLNRLPKIFANLCAKIASRGWNPQVFLDGDKIGQDISGTKFVAMDLITVYYARDVLMQSELGNTTQETLLRYLQLKQHIYSLCVLNTGLHDQLILGFKKEVYVLNVIEFLEKMSLVCQHMIWIETTTPRGDKNRPQTIVRTREWNTALHSYLDAHRHINVSMMRVFEKSLKARHVDNVHLHRSWYREMAITLFEELYKDGQK